MKAKKKKWAEVYRLKKGMPAKFACASFPNGVDLTNENLPITILDKIFAAGIKNIEKIEKPTK